MPGFIHAFIHLSISVTEHVELTPRAREFDAQTVASALKQINYFERVAQLVDVVCRISFGCEAAQMSYLYFLHYVACAGGLDALLETAQGGGQEFRLVGGAQQLSDKVHAMLGADRVRLLSHATQVIQDNDSVTVHWCVGCQ